jgi:hypothetical protein
VRARQRLCEAPELTDLVPRSAAAQRPDDGAHAAAPHAQRLGNDSSQPVGEEDADDAGAERVCCRACSMAVP